MAGNAECLPLVELPTTYSLNSAFETLFPFKQGSWALEMARLTRSAFNLLGTESYGISGSAPRRLAYTGTDHTLPVWRGIQAICEPLLQDREVIIPLDDSEYRALITMFSGPIDLVQRQDGLLIKDHRLGKHVSNKQNAVASATSDRQGDWQIMIEPEIISCLSRLSTIEQPSYLNLAQAFISGFRTVRNELQFPALHPPMYHSSQNPRIELETILKYQAALVKVPCHGEFTDYDCQEIITEAILCLCFDRLNAVRLLHEMSLLEKFVPGLAQQYGEKLSRTIINKMKQVHLNTANKTDEEYYDDYMGIMNIVSPDLIQ